MDRDAAPVLDNQRCASPRSTSRSRSPTARRCAPRSAPSSAAPVSRRKLDAAGFDPPRWWEHPTATSRSRSRSPVSSRAGGRTSRGRARRRAPGRPRSSNRCVAPGTTTSVGLGPRPSPARACRFRSSTSSSSPADDQQRRRADVGERRPGQVGPAAAGDDGTHDVGLARGRHERRGGAGAGAEQADRQPARLARPTPPSAPPPPTRPARSSMSKRVLARAEVDLLLGRREQVDEQGREAGLLEHARHEAVARAEAAATRSRARTRRGRAPPAGTTSAASEPRRPRPPAPAGTRSSSRAPRRRTPRGSPRTRGRRRGTAPARAARRRSSTRPRQLADGVRRRGRHGDDDARAAPASARASTAAAHRRAGREAVVDDARRSSRAARAAAGRRGRRAPRGPAPRPPAPPRRSISCSSRPQLAHDLLVEDADAAARDRAHRQLRLPREAELAHEEDVERRPQRAARPRAPPARRRAAAPSTTTSPGPSRLARALAEEPSRLGPVAEAPAVRHTRRNHVLLRSWSARAGTAAGSSESHHCADDPVGVLDARARRPAARARARPRLRRRPERGLARRATAGR